MQVRSSVACRNVTGKTRADKALIGRNIATLNRRTCIAKEAGANE